jgi:predicted RNA-binding protein associated with RNAse of E/G family
VDELFIDVIVGPPDHPYRMLDLNEYADAMTTGRLDRVQAADGLRRAQHFSDRRLNRRHDTSRAWPSFPPDEVMELMTAPLPRDWTLLPR